MTKNTLFTIFICSILLSGSFFAISSSLNFSPFVFAQEQQAESTTDPPADTSTTDPPADTSTTDPPADTSTDPSIVTLQHDDVEINQPVQWTATVDVADPQQTIAIEVPSDAQNTLVMNSDGQIVEASVISDPSLLDTTTDVAEITDPKVMEENAETDLVVVDEPGEILNIEFETSAPYTEEAELVTEDSYQKTVTVKSDSELHYTNVKSYSDLPEDLAASGVEFKLYWMIDGVKTDVTTDPRFAVEFVDTDGNGIANQMQWIVPRLSEQTFVIEAVITIINVQSYPVVGGEWTVRFTTVGTADLIITGIDGTTFGETAPADLQFLELNDGTQILSPEISGNSIIYRGYSSTAEGYETSLVLTEGVHTLEFKFGNDIEYAYNDASAAHPPTSIGTDFDAWTLTGTTKVAALSDSSGSTYIETSTAGAKQTFGFGPYTDAEIPFGSTITGVKVDVSAKRIVNPSSLKIIATSGTPTPSSASSGVILLGNAFGTESFTFTTNPDTGSAWTEAQVKSWANPDGSSAFFGVEHVAGTPRVAEISIVVLFTPPAFTKITLDQCRNGGTAGTNPLDCIDSPSGWQNGNAGQTNSHFVEGGSMPLRAVMTGLSMGGHKLIIKYDVLEGGKHAYDYLTYARRISEVVDPCSGIAGLPGSITSCPLPASGSVSSPLTEFDFSTKLGTPTLAEAPTHPALDSKLPITDLGHTGVPDVSQPITSFNTLSTDDRRLVMIGGSILDMKYGSQGDLTDTGNQLTFVEIKFTATNPTAIISWGGHIGSRNDWGFVGTEAQSAGGITGSSYHMHIEDLDGQGGSQDRSL